MDLFVKKLVQRENEKGELAANYDYVRLYLEELANLLQGDNRIQNTDVLRAFAHVTNENGLSREEYSSNHLIDLFQQLGFLTCVDGKWIYIDEMYAEYMEALAIDLIEN